MQQTLEQLYNGEIYPNEQLKVHARGYQEARKTAFEAYEALKNKLCQTMRGELDTFLGKDFSAKIPRHPPWKKHRFSSMGFGLVPS